MNDELVKKAFEEITLKTKLVISHFVTDNLRYFLIVRELEHWNREIWEVYFSWYKNSTVVHYKRIK